MIEIFRDYDIRAVADKELTDDLVSLIGKAFGSYLLNHGGATIVLGKDNRISSDRISETLITSLLSTGCNVINLGNTTTPIVCYAMQCLYGIDSNVMVTGSHNPAEYNGIKLQIGKEPFFGNELKSLETIILNKDFRIGNGSYSEVDIHPVYVKDIREQIQISRNIKVVLDCGSGNTCLIAPKLINDLGCEVVPLFCSSNGRFPGHHPNPAIKENMTYVVDAVQKTNSDIGIGFDGDGNRIGIIDDKGNYVSPDLILSLLAKSTLEELGPQIIVCEVKTSQVLEDVVSRYGGDVIMSKVGYPYLLHEMFTNNATIAGELTGHICINNPPFQYGDAIYVACKIIELVSKKQVPLSSLLSELPTYYSSNEIRIPCPNTKRMLVLEKAKEYFAKDYKLLLIDGIRVNFNNYGWALIRTSNTEPVISIRFEAKTTSDFERIRDILLLFFCKAELFVDPKAFDHNHNI